MMFQADIAIALSLIAIGVGFWVLTKSNTLEETGLKITGKFFGYLILVVAVLTLLCTTYYTLKYWEDGAFRSTNNGQCMSHGGAMMQGHGSMMMGGKDMDRGGMDADCPMMKKGKMSGHMKGMMGNGEKSMMDMDKEMMDRGSAEDEDEDDN